MKKSKTDLFIIFVPTREEPMGLGGWVNRCAIDSLQQGKNRGEQTDNRKRCGVYRRLNTVLSTGWAKGCSLHMCHTQVGVVFFIKRQHNVYKMISNSCGDIWWKSNFITSVKTLNFIERFLSNWFFKTNIPDRTKMRLEK